MSLLFAIIGSLLFASSSLGVPQGTPGSNGYIAFRKDANNFLQNLETLIVDDTIFEGKGIEVTLVKQPQGPVTASFFSPDGLLTFDQCQIKWSKYTFDRWKPLKINSGKPIFTQVNLQKIKMQVTFSAPQDPDYNGKTFEFYVTRKMIEPRLCSSYGDPHYTTFKNKRFTVLPQGGVYTLIQTDRLTIHTKQDKCLPTFACNSDIAIRYLNHYIRFSPGQAPQRQGQNADKVNIKTAGVYTEFQLSDGTVISVVTQGGTFFDIFIALPNGYNTANARGYCGGYDGQNFNSPDVSGHLNGLWMANDQGTLFGCIASNSCAQTFPWNGVDAAGCQYCANPTSAVAQQVLPSPYSAVSLSKRSEENPDVRCKTALEGKTCGPIDQDVLLDYMINCDADLTNGNANAAAGYKSLWKYQCLTYIESASLSMDSQERANAQALRQKYSADLVI